MNIWGKLFLSVLGCYGLYEYLCMIKRKFKEAIKNYMKLKEIEKELRNEFKIKKEN